MDKRAFNTVDVSPVNDLTQMPLMFNLVLKIFLGPILSITFVP